jgi:hypothetical protein
MGPGRFCPLRVCVADCLFILGMALGTLRRVIGTRLPPATSAQQQQSQAAPNGCQLCVGHPFLLRKFTEHIT